MSEPGGGRPDDEPTINEAGTTGFAIDGTDSFAVPGPADGSPPEVGAEPDLAAVVGRRRIAVTLAAAILLLAAVIGLGSAGGDDDRLAGDEQVGEAPSVPTTEQPTTEGRRTPLAPDDAETLARLEAAGGMVPTDSTAYDQMYTVDTTFTDPYATDESFDPFDDDSFSDDEYVGRYVPSVTRPRTFPTIPRRILPTTPGTTTTVASATTTTALSTTTTDATTTTATPTPTTAPTPTPTRAWEPATSGLGLDCGDRVQVWARPGSLVAAVGSRGLFASTDAGTTWSALSGGPVGTSALVEPVGAPAGTFWVASERGVFSTADGGAMFTEVGDLRSASALSVAVGSSGSVALAVSNGIVHRWADGAGAAWAPLAGALPSGAVPGQVLAIDATTALIGTSVGVLRTTNGGQTLDPVSSVPVVGVPVVEGNSIWWLRPAAAGVLHSADAGATWSELTGSGVAPDATTLARVPRVGLVTTGTAATLVSLADGGATWTPLDPAPPYRPTSIVHSAQATLIGTSDCDLGSQRDAGDSVLRLRDAVS